MAIEGFLFFGIVFMVLLLIAWRNGAFQRGGPGTVDDRSSFPQIQPTGLSGQSIRDPRAKLDAGDKLGRR